MKTSKAMTMTKRFDGGSKIVKPALGSSKHTSNRTTMYTLHRLHPYCYVHFIGLFCHKLCT